MGNKSSSQKKKKKKNKVDETGVLVIGLEASGKSTLVKYLNPSRNMDEKTIPTIGYDIQRFYMFGN